MVSHRQSVARPIARSRLSIGPTGPCRVRPMSASRELQRQLKRIEPCLPRPATRPPAGPNREASLFAMLHPARVQIKLGFAFAVAILLCGCIADQKKQVAACEMDAKRTYPDKTLHGTPPSIDMADFIQACMRWPGTILRAGQTICRLAAAIPATGRRSKLRTVGLRNRTVA